MMKRKIVLWDTSIGNVHSYVHDKLKELEESDFQQEDIRYHSFYVFNHDNKIEVECLASISGKVRWPVITFEVYPLQTNTVRLKSECRLTDLEPIFNSCWDDILEDFGIVQPNRMDIKKAEKPGKHNSQFYDRAMMWRNLEGWMKLGNVRPKPKDCIAELKKKPAYKSATITRQLMQKILNEGFAGEYEDALKNI